MSPTDIRSKEVRDAAPGLYFSAITRLQETTSMFEHRTEPLLTRLQFAWRMSKAFSVTVLLAALSMLIGILGYHFLVGKDWDDSFHFACLVLGKSDAAIRPESTVGKVFAGLYVMYGGLVFVSMIAIVAAPVLHRILHTLHLDTDQQDS